VEGGRQGTPVVEEKNVAPHPLAPPGVAAGEIDQESKR